MISKIFVINGPNLNLLGEREPQVYGTTTLADIRQSCEAKAAASGLDVDFRQSNHEGELIDWIHEARHDAQGIVINAGAYTHTSVALHDALAAFAGPIIEVHLSNVFRRETFRHHSYISPVATGVICGLGPVVYTLALDAMTARLTEPR